jgi:hypothetical protein
MRRATAAMGADPERFLARWSRRKQAARRGEPATEPAPEPAVPPEPAAPAEPELPGPAAPAQPELPDPDSLGADGDFKAFLRPGVPAELRKRALRRLWRVNPIIGAHDGLDDVFKDFTDAATVVPDLKTAYRVGRGLLDRLGEAEAPVEAAEPRDAPGEDGGADAAPRPERKDA